MHRQHMGHMKITDEELADAKRVYVELSMDRVLGRLHTSGLRAPAELGLSLGERLRDREVRPPRPSQAAAEALIIEESAEGPTLRVGRQVPLKYLARSAGFAIMVLALGAGFVFIATLGKFDLAPLEAVLLAIGGGVAMGIFFMLSSMGGFLPTRLSIDRRGLSIRHGLFRKRIAWQDLEIAKRVPMLNFCGSPIISHNIHYAHVWTRADRARSLAPWGR